MKTLFTVFVACFWLNAMACDGSKSDLTVTLYPGVPQTITWDFSDCWFGITCDKFLVIGANRKALSGGIPLTVTLFDATTGVYYQPDSSGYVFYDINNCQSVCGHIIQITLTLSTKAKKPLGVEILQLADLGGPCQ